jgi:ParB-like chromosome segregation protein Spo0J
MEMNGFELKRMPLATLKPAPYNPRAIEPDQMAALKASLARWGIVEPIIVNKRTGYVVGGNQRLTALLDSGAKETTVLYVDLDDENERALNIALNRIVGGFNDALLRAAVIELRATNVPLEILGFTADERAVLLAPVQTEGGRGADQQEPPETYCCPQCGHEWKGA